MTGRMSNTTPVSRIPPPGGPGPATLPGRAAHREHYMTFRAVCTGGPEALVTFAPMVVAFACAWGSPGPSGRLFRRRSVPGHGPRAAGSRSGDSGRPVLHADPRTHGLRRLGDAVFPRALARAAHHDQVAVPQGETQALSATDGAEQERTRGAERHDGDHGVRRPPASDAVAVPGDAVATVAVQAHTCTDESLAQFRAVVAVEVLAGLGEQRVRQRLVAAVPAQQPRDGDLPLVHLPAVLPPADVTEQDVEDRIRSGDPAGQVIHPGAGAELVSHHLAGQRAERGLLRQVPHRGLRRPRPEARREPASGERDGVLPGVLRHAGTLLRGFAHMCETLWTTAGPWPRPEARPERARGSEGAAPPQGSAPSLR